jgi:hypothetical protein
LKIQGLHVIIVEEVKMKNFFFNLGCVVGAIVALFLFLAIIVYGTIFIFGDKEVWEPRTSILNNQYFHTEVTTYYCLVGSTNLVNSKKIIFRPKMNGVYKIQAWKANYRNQDSLDKELIIDKSGSKVERGLHRDVYRIEFFYSNGKIFKSFRMRLGR